MNLKGQRLTEDHYCLSSVKQPSSNTENVKDCECCMKDFTEFVTRLPSSPGWRDYWSCEPQRGRSSWGRASWREWPEETGGRLWRWCPSGADPGAVERPSQTPRDPPSTGRHGSPWAAHLHKEKHSLLTCRQMQLKPATHFTTWNVLMKLGGFIINYRPLLLNSDHSSLWVCHTHCFESEKEWCIKQVPPTFLIDSLSRIAMPHFGSQSTWSSLKTRIGAAHASQWTTIVVFQ